MNYALNGLWCASNFARKVRHVYPLEVIVLCKERSYHKVESQHVVS